MLTWRRVLSACWRRKGSDVGGLYLYLFDLRIHGLYRVARCRDWKRALAELRRGNPYICPLVVTALSAEGGDGEVSRFRRRFAEREVWPDVFYLEDVVAEAVGLVCRAGEVIYPQEQKGR